MHVASRIERLESRTMLATDAGVAVFGGKLEPRVWDAVQHAGQIDSPARTDQKGDVQLDLHIDGKLSSALDALGSLGLRMGAIDDANRVVEAWVPPALLQTLSQLSTVASIDLPDYRVVRTGSVNTAGDSLLLADRVRNQFAAYGIDGSGIKVGVISDGVDHRANVGADLSPVTVNPTIPGSGDEGTAMLEIVHDLAPGAQLYFSGPDTAVEMVSSINWLMSQGCNVIVDDLGFYDQPFFADGSIALAAQNAVNSGVVYVSAAGNESVPIGGVGDFHYQHQFVDDGTTTHLHNFNPDGTTPDDYLDFTVLAGGSISVILQWSDPFGASTNDYDLFLYNQSHTTMLKKSEDFQTGTQDPIESFDYNNPSSTSPTQVAIRIRKFSGLSRELEMFVLGDAKPLEYVTPAGSIIGHPAAPGVISVGAIDAADSGSDAMEYYSSQGPTTIYTNFTTQTKTLRNSLTGAAIDGVQTRVGQIGDFDNPFFGTSAAAPHAAAIAALIRDVNPSLSPVQVKQIMQDTAVDLTAYGTGYDPVSGSGRFNALDAVFEAFTPAQPDLTDSSDTGVSFTDNITRDNTPTFTGTVPAGSLVSLLVDGETNTSTQLGGGATTYGITTTALNDGPHSIAIRVASGTPALANASPSSAALAITLDRVAPIITPLAFEFQSAQAVTYLVSEDVSATLNRGEIHIRNRAGDIEVSDDATTAAIAPVADQYLVRFTLSNPSIFILSDGNYYATLDASNLTDLAGNQPTAPAAINFFVFRGDVNRDRVVNALDFNALAAHFGMSNVSFNDGDFNYDGVVNSSDFAALAMRFNAHLSPPTTSAPDPAQLFSSQPLNPIDAIQSPPVLDWDFESV